MNPPAKPKPPGKKAKPGTLRNAVMQIRVALGRARPNNKLGWNGEKLPKPKPKPGNLP